MHINLQKYREVLEHSEFSEYYGRVSKVVGLTIESDGPEVNIGELCKLHTSRGNKIINAEVVGFKDNKVLLMPLGEMSGIGPGSLVVASNAVLRVGVGKGLMGRVIDGMGNPLDNKGPLQIEKYYPVYNNPPHPLRRKRINEPLVLGVKAIDGLITVGKGQRVGIFAGSGVGKSTLVGMIARNTKADINVIALIGERGREVREFLEKDLKDEGLARSVVIVATSDQPAFDQIERRADCDCGCRVFPGSGQGCAFIDGFSDKVCNGPARGRTGDRRTACFQRIHAFGVRNAAEAAGTLRKFRERLYNRPLFGACGWRRHD